MDNFTLSVVIGDVVMIALIVILILMDIKAATKTPSTGPAKVAGKRPA